MSCSYGRQQFLVGRKGYKKSCIFTTDSLKGPESRRRCRRAGLLHPLPQVVRQDKVGERVEQRGEAGDGHRAAALQRRPLRVGPTLRLLLQAATSGTDGRTDGVGRSELIAVNQVRSTSLSFPITGRRMKSRSELLPTDDPVSHPRRRTASRSSCSRRRSWWRCTAPGGSP